MTAATHLGPNRPAPNRPAPDRALEAAIARLLTLGTYASVALLVAGTLLLLAAGRSPLEPGPAFDPAGIPADIVALRPAGFLWLGILGLLVTPTARVAMALVGYARAGDRRMALVAALILVVLAAGVAAGTAAG